MNKLPYKLPKNNDKLYITPTVRKYFKYALEYALQNNTNGAKVNGTIFKFDFENKKVNVWTGYYHRRDYDNSIVCRDDADYDLIENK